jgi:hypothetical protein
MREGEGVQPLALVGAFQQHGGQLARAGGVIDPGCSRGRLGTIWLRR